MRGLNHVMLVGNLGRDPDVKVLEGGLVVARIMLATTEIYRARDASLQAKTEWHTVIFWQALAELAGKYLKKGSLILVEGKIRHRKYEDKAGVVRYVTEVVANEMIMLDKKTSSVDPVDDETLWTGLAPF